MIHGKRQILFIAFHGKFTPQLLSNNIADAIFQFFIEESVPTVIFNLSCHCFILAFQIGPVTDVRILRKPVIPVNGTAKHLLCLRQCIGKQIRNSAVTFCSVSKPCAAVTGSHKGSLPGCTAVVGSGNSSCHAGQYQIPALIFSDNTSHGTASVSTDRTVHVGIINAAQGHDSCDPAYISFPLDPVRHPVLGDHCIIDQVSLLCTSCNTSYSTILLCTIHGNSFCPAILHNDRSIRLLKLRSRQSAFSASAEHCRNTSRIVSGIHITGYSHIPDHSAVLHSSCQNSDLIQPPHLVTLNFQIFYAASIDHAKQTQICFTGKLSGNFQSGYGISASVKIPAKWRWNLSAHFRAAAIPADRIPVPAVDGNSSKIQALRQFEITALIIIPGRNGLGQPHQMRKRLKLIGRLSCSFSRKIHIAVPVLPHISGYRNLCRQQQKIGWRCRL